MRIVMSIEEMERWALLYQNTNPSGDLEKWKRDLLNTIIVCFTACFSYRFETSHLFEKDKPFVAIHELSDRVLDTLIAEVEGDTEVDISALDNEDAKDYEEEYRLLLEDILTTFYIFTGKIDLHVLTSDQLLKKSQLSMEISEAECIIDIQPQRTAT